MARKQNFLNKNKGFSLAIVLLLITVLGGVITGIVVDSRDTVIRQEAEIAGWEGAMVARAARLYARDQLVANPNLAIDLSPANLGPQDVPLTDFLNQSTLPTNFGRQSGGQIFNALGQPIRVILANFPINGDPNDVTTVPTAYVYFQDNIKSNGSIVQDIVEEARREGVSVAAPIFSGGTNVSDLCNGNPSAVMWDTGCMDTTEFTELTGDTFVEGSFVIPSWRAVNFDTRALLRFPQPENTGLPTMLTELEMGEITDCISNPALAITIPADDGTADSSDICSALSDSGALVDNRRDIIGARNIQSDSFIVNPQTGNDVFIDNTSGANSTRVNEIYGLNVAGSIDAVGDVKVYDGDINTTGTLIADKNIVVARENPGTAVTAFIGSINASDSTSTGLVVSNRPNMTADISIQNSVAVNGSTTINAALVTQNLQMTGSGANTINVSGNANMLGNSNYQSLAISGARSTGSYSYVTGELNSNRDMTVNGRVTSADTISFLGTSAATRINVHNSSNNAECLDDCPERELDEFCRNITGMTYSECRVTFR